MARLLPRAAAQSDPSPQGDGGNDAASDHSQDGAHSESDVAVVLAAETEFSSFREFVDALLDHVGRTGHWYSTVNSSLSETYNARHSAAIPAAMGPYKYCVFRCRCKDTFRYHVGVVEGGARWGIRISCHTMKPCSKRLTTRGRKSRDVVAFFERYLEGLDESNSDHAHDDNSDSDEEREERVESSGNEGDVAEDDSQGDADSDRDLEEEEAKGNDGSGEDQVEPSDEEDADQGQHSPDVGLELDDGGARSDSTDFGSPDLLNQRPPRAPSSALARGRAQARSQVQAQAQAQAQGHDRDARRSHVNGKKKAATVRVRHVERGRSNNRFDDGSDGMDDDSEAVDQVNDDFGTPDRSTKRHAGLPAQDQAARRGANGAQFGNIEFSPGILHAIANGKGLAPARIYISSGGRRDNEES